MPKWMQASRLLLGKSSKQFVLSSLLQTIMLPKLILGLFLYAGVCRQCRGDHLRTVGSTDADSEVQDPGLASTSHREPQIHEPSCSTESAEEIVEPP